VSACQSPAGRRRLWQPPFLQPPDKVVRPLPGLLTPGTTPRHGQPRPPSPPAPCLPPSNDRRLVLAAGAFIWGAMTSAIALSTHLSTAMLFAAVNGLGLALLVPCCQSLVADLHPPERRGRAFGLMQLTGALGGMLGSVFATNMGAADPAATWGVDGWRVAFHAVAAVSIVTGGHGGHQAGACAQLWPRLLARPPGAHPF
jgi:MFS family permease